MIPIKKQDEIARKRPINTFPMEVVSVAIVLLSIYTFSQPKIQNNSFGRVDGLSYNHSNDSLDIPAGNDNARA
jgi:hypothetical protein